jgi:hypothetical protein
MDSDLQLQRWLTSWPLDGVAIGKRSRIARMLYAFAGQADPEFIESYRKTLVEKGILRARDEDWTWVTLAYMIHACDNNVGEFYRDKTLGTWFVSVGGPYHLDGVPTSRETLREALTPYIRTTAEMSLEQLQWLWVYLTPEGDQAASTSMDAWQGDLPLPPMEPAMEWLGGLMSPSSTAAEPGTLESKVAAVASDPWGLEPSPARAKELSLLPLPRRKEGPLRRPIADLPEDASALRSGQRSGPAEQELSDAEIIKLADELLDRVKEEEEKRSPAERILTSDEAEEMRRARRGHPARPVLLTFLYLQS